MAEGNSNGGGSNVGNGGGGAGTKVVGQNIIPLSPPKAEVDETPIQTAKNKESLKVKLMLRRPIAQLVEQGILPSPKTPQAFHEQRQKLERAKMGDLLKNKIQRRPDRQELIQQHILEDSNIDPSLQERQRQLKKARLADDLNDRLSHRPGPLELIKGNILKTDDEFAQAVKEGQISFKKTSEGELRKHPPPLFVFEEDSSSEGALSPLQDSDQSQVGSIQSNSGATLGSASDLSLGANFIPNSSAILGSHLVSNSPSLASSSAASSSLSPLSSVSSPASFTLSPGAVPPPPLLSPTGTVTSPTVKSASSSSSPARSETREQARNRKKSKSKSQPKTRTIKFHEYKGPPNALKTQPLSSTTPVESSYELLLQQQQLFLQWQLEWQHKYPQIILPNAQKTIDGSNSTQPTLGLVAAVVASNSASAQAGSGNQIAPAQQQNLQQPALQPQPQQLQTLQESPVVSRCLSKLEDMKVSDLKVELKKRNLPVSGSKPQLIERLRPFSDIITNGGSLSASIGVDANSNAASTSASSTAVTNSSSGNSLAGHIGIPVDSPPTSNQVAMNIGDDGMPNTMALSPLPVMSGITEVNNNTVTASSISPDSSLDGMSNLGGTPPHSASYKVMGSNSSIAGVAFSPVYSNVLQGSPRPSSVAPMDVDINSNAGFDSMDIGEIGHSLSPDNSGITYQTSSANNSNNGSSGNSNVHSTNEIHSANEELLKKKIEELQRELQRESEVWQQPEESSSDFGFYQLGLLNPRMQLQLQQQQQQAQLHQQQIQQLLQQQSQQYLQQLHQQQMQQMKQVQIKQEPNLPAQVAENLPQVSTSSGSQTSNDVKLQQKLLLQQHLQQKIQQQQLQQQLLQQSQQQHQESTSSNTPTPSASSNPNMSAKASLAAFLQAQGLSPNNSNINCSSAPSSSSATSKAKVFFTTPAATTSSSATNSGLKNAQQKQSYLLNQLNTKKQRAGSLPNGYSHQRTASLPNFVNANNPQAKAAVMRTTTDPQFVITKPPPDYNEATKQLNKQQFAQGLLNNLVNPPRSGQKSVKSQAVDDVLEILIKNGELPPSAAQDPTTPTTPKTLPSGLLFTTTSSPSQTASSSTTATSPMSGLASSMAHAITTSTPSPLQSILNRPSPSPPLSTPPPPPPPPLPSHNHLSSGAQQLKLCTTVAPSLGDVVLGSPDLDVNLDLDGLEAMDIGQLTQVPGSTDLPDPTMHMDIDEWLDVMMPSTTISRSTISTGIGGQGSHCNEHDCTGDPLLSNSQDPFDLFNIDDNDLKISNDLSSLWDKVDFAT